MFLLSHHLNQTVKETTLLKLLSGVTPGLLFPLGSTHLNSMFLSLRYGPQTVIHCSGYSLMGRSRHFTSFKTSVHSFTGLLPIFQRRYAAKNRDCASFRYYVEWMVACICAENPACFQNIQPVKNVVISDYI